MECSAEEEENRISPLVYTSLLLTTNVATAYMAAEYYYAFLFAVLTLTSVMVHLEEDENPDDLCEAKRSMGFLSFAKGMPECL
jgi:hypothetical protein